MKIRGPDGVSYSLPDGLSDDDISSFLDQQYGAFSVTPTPEKSFGQKAENLGRGLLESASRAKGGILTTAGVSAERFFPETGAALKQEGARLQNLDFGYEPTTTFEDVKQDPLGNVLPYIAETGFTSLPEMGTYIASPAVGLLQSVGQIAQQRAQNQGRNVPTLQDASSAAPAALASGALESVGIGKIFGEGAGEIAKQGVVPALKDIGRSAATEAVTEGIQSPIEYAGATIGTRTGFDPVTAIEQSAQGALVGAGVGGSLRAGVSAASVMKARELAPYVKPGDVESPLPTDLIAEGRKMADDAAKPLQKQVVTDIEFTGNQTQEKIPVPKQIPDNIAAPDQFVDLYDENGNVIGEYNRATGVGRPKQAAPSPVTEQQSPQPLQVPTDNALSVQSLPVQDVAPPEQERQALPDLPPEPAQPAALEQSSKYFSKDIPPPAPGLPRPRDEMGRTYVKEDTADLADRTKIPVKYAIVEADSLITSNNDDMRQNQAYPKELQPRQRERAASLLQITEMANNLEPRWLDNNVKAADGAPVVGPDNIVDSGNGRTIAIRTAYNTGKADNYRQYLIDQYPEAASYNKPVLVRVRQNDMTLEQRISMNKIAQDGGTLKQSEAEKAIADAGELDDATLQKYQGGDIQSLENAPFVRAFNYRVLGVNDMGGQAKANAELSAEGVRRINNALLAKAYGDPNLIALMTEDTDSNIVSIGKALQDNAASFAQMVSEARSGRISPAADVTPQLIEAVRMVQSARRRGRALSDAVNQIDVNGNPIDPITERFLKLMFQDRVNFKNAVSRKRLSNSIKQFIESMRTTQATNDILGEAAITPEQALDAAIKSLDESYGKVEYDDERPNIPPITVPPKAGGENKRDISSTEKNVGERKKPAAKTGARKQNSKTTKVALEAKGLSGDTTEQFDKKSKNIAQRIYRAALRSFGAQLRVNPVDDTLTYQGTEATGAFYTAENDGGFAEYWAAVSLAGRSDGQTLATLNHEGIHYLRTIGALDGVWPALAKKAQIWMRDFGIKDVPAYASLSEAQQLEEAVAVAYSKWFTGDLKQTGFAARFFENLKTFVGRVKAFFRSEKFTHWEDVFQDIKEGAFRSVPAKADAGPVAPEPLPAARNLSFRRNSVFVSPTHTALLRNDPAARQRINSIAGLKDHEAKIARFQSRRAVVSGIEAKLRGEMETLLSRNLNLKTSVKSTKKVLQKNKRTIKKLKDRFILGNEIPEKISAQAENIIDDLLDKNYDLAQQREYVKTSRRENALSLERVQRKLASANKMLQVLDAKIANSEAAQDAIWASIQKEGNLEIKAGDKFDVFSKLDLDGRAVDTKYFPATSAAKAPAGYTTQGQFEVWGQPGGRPLLKRELSEGEKAALKQRNDSLAVQPMTGLFDHLYSYDKDIYGKEAAMQWVKLQSDDMIRNFQDRFLDLTRMTEAIEQAGFVLPDEANVDLLRRTWAAKAADRIENLKRDYVDPILQGLVARDIDLAEFEEYLYAKVAPEVNAAVSKINPAFNQDEGSGMTNAQAARVLEAVEQAGKTADFEAIAKLVWAMNNDALKLATDAELITPDTARVWREQYPHYVPLRGNQELLGDDPELPKIGSGFSIKGEESKRRMGRSSRAETILAYAISQAEQTIVRAEKNTVSQAMIELATAFPDENIWSLEKVETRPVLSNGVVVMRPAKPIQDRDYTLSAKIKGEEFRLTFEKKNKVGQELANAFRNLDATQMNAVFQFMRTFTNLFKAVNTRFSPNFTLKNLARDLGFAAITLTKYEEKGLVKDVLSDYRKSMTAAYRATKGDFSGEWGQWVKEFSAAGSRTSIIDMKNVADLAASIERDLKDLKSGLTPKKVFDKTLRAIDNVNNAIETAIRLSVYKNLRERGYSKEKAANAARRVTTDFNLRGKASPSLNALYAFSNAAIQGTTESLKALTHKNVQRISGGLVLAGAMMALLNALISPGDEDGKSVYSKISDTDKSKNLVLVLPEGLASKNMPYIRPIPLPPFFGMFWNLGRHIAEAALGVSTPGDAAANMAINAVDSVNPLGGMQSLLSLIAPTIADPIVDIATNKDWTGKPIVPDHGKYDYRPDSQKYYSNTSEISKNIAAAMNGMTGGSDVEKGLVDVSPNTLDYLFGYATGGTGRFFKGLIDYAQGIADPVRENKPSSLPLVGQFLGNDMSWYPARTYYDRRDKINAFVDYAEQYREAGRNKELNALYEKDGRLDDMQTTLKISDRDLKRLKADRAEIEADYAERKIKRDEYAKRIQKNDAEQKAVFDDFNKEWNGYQKRGVIQ